MILIPPYLTNISNIRRFKQRQEFILDHYYAHYIYFQRERSKRFEQIKESILKNTLRYDFKNWHRVIDLAFVESALSSLGSLLNDPGGRFNIGSIDDIKFSKFPALYIAEDYEIAYREKNQIVPTEKLDSGLSSDELSLTNLGSTVDLLVEGHIESIIDLTDENVLRDFYEVIKDIKLTSALEREAKRLNVPIMYHVKSHDELRRSILHDEWRHAPALADIPANSQIFGQLVHECGVEAILYPSSKSQVKKCLAIYPKNFFNSTSYVKIQDKSLPENIRHSVLNSETYYYL